jgi:hypothetical protein
MLKLAAGAHRRLTRVLGCLPIDSDDADLRRAAPRVDNSSELAVEADLLTDSDQ